jgi:DNA topoisomerase-1
MNKLIHVTRAALTVTRRRAGRGFCYFDADGNLICDTETKSRLKALGIPPAWEDVRIAHHPRAHIQAVGKDEAGRLQYIYHEAWEERRRRRKREHLQLLTTALPAVRRRVVRDLGAETGSPELALAIAVALIDRSAMRVGREKYLKTSGTRGAGTLYARDVRVRNGHVAMSFPAKSGKQAQYDIADRRLAEAVQRIKTLTGRRLLVYRNGSGELRPITGDMINAYLAKAAESPVTAKDFRTLHASALAGETLAAMEPAPSATSRKRQMTAVTRQVAEFLQNTPAISRKSYIAPCLFELFEDGRLQRLWSREGDRGPRGLRVREQRLGQVLAAVG